jgi:hypothetical protein
MPKREYISRTYCADVLKSRNLYQKYTYVVLAWHFVRMILNTRNIFQKLPREYTYIALVEDKENLSEECIRSISQHFARMILNTRDIYQKFPRKYTIDVLY